MRTYSGRATFSEKAKELFSDPELGWEVARAIRESIASNNPVIVVRGHVLYRGICAPAEKKK